MMHTIETESLSHHFRAGEPILTDIHLQVPQGSIFGFLGPNGAGKTTTLRLLLGLLRKQQGRISLFGMSLDGHRSQILQQTGTLIESPSIYPQLTAVQNLLVWQKVFQCQPARVQQVLEIVGLAHTGKKRAGQFSLGMKQRLSIAIALLHQPKLLILDEPTNGLDPKGMVEVRALLQRLNAEENMTVLVSSHLLAEIEKLVTHVGIIHQGKMLFQGTLSALQEKQNLGAEIQFEVSEVHKAAELAKGMGLNAQVKEGLLCFPVADRDTIARLNALLVQQGHQVSGIATRRDDLERIFMDLTQN